MRVQLQAVLVEVRIQFIRSQNLLPKDKHNFKQSSEHNGTEGYFLEVIHSCLQSSETNTNKMQEKMKSHENNTKTVIHEYEAHG